MYQTKEQRLLYAAKTSIALLSLAYETLWELYPDELLSLKEYDEAEIIAAFKKALFKASEEAAPAQDHSDLDDIF